MLFIDTPLFYASKQLWQFYNFNGFSCARLLQFVQCFQNGFLVKSCAGIFDGAIGVDNHEERNAHGIKISVSENSQLFKIIGHWSHALILYVAVYLCFRLLSRQSAPAYPKYFSSRLIIFFILIGFAIKSLQPESRAFTTSAYIA